MDEETCRSAAPGRQDAMMRNAPYDSSQRAAQDNCSSGSGLYDEARRASLSGDKTGAKAILLRHLQGQPSHSNGWNELGALVFGEGDFQGAIECFKKAVLFDPQNAAALENLVETCVSAERYNEAALLASQWTQSAPQCAAAWVVWAKLNLMSGNSHTAREALVKAFALDPSNRFVNEALAALAAERNAPVHEDGVSTRVQRRSAAGSSPLPFLRPLPPNPVIVAGDEPPLAQAWRNRNGRPEGSRPTGAPRKVQGSPADPPILWSGPVLFPGGYSYLSKQTVLWLRQAGVKVELNHLGIPDNDYVRTFDLTDLRALKETMREHTRDGVFIFCHQPALADARDIALRMRWRRPEHLAYVCLTMFETTGLPAHWVEPCNQLDEIWVPSSFNVETFAEAGVERSRLRRVGFGIDPTLYDPDPIEPMPVPGRRGFMFLSVFQWQARKGWPILLEAFARAFTSRDDVCLVIKSTRPRGDTGPIDDGITEFLARRGLPRSQCAPIIVIEGAIRELDMRRLYRAADAFVLPTRGEGWGIPFMEAMATGLPTIGTRWSGHLDFMNDENSYLIDVKRFVETDHEMLKFNPEYAGLQYAEPDTEHLIHLMRHVHKNRQAASDLGQKARRDICANWTSTQYVQRIRQACRDLMGRAHDRRISSSAHGESKLKDLLPVILHGPALDPSGYAHDFRGLALNLRRSGVDIRLDHQLWNERYGLVPNEDCAALAEIMNPELPVGPHISIENPLRPPPDPDPDAYRIVRMFWETDRCPGAMARHCLEADEVWVASSFNVEPLVRTGVPRGKIHVVPSGLPMEKYGPHARPFSWADPERFTFLACFDVTLRKGWDLLLNAFFKEFGPEEDVALALNIHSSLNADTDYVIHQLERWAKHLARKAWLDEEGEWRSARPPIIFVREDLHADDMPRFYRSGDAYVMPSRGEGWALPALEAMASGLPVIATAWGGHMDYMDPETEFLVPYRMVPVPAEACQEARHFAGQMWAEPDLSELRRKMRLVKEARQFALGRATVARQRIVKLYDSKAVAEKVLDRLGEISARLRAGGASIRASREPSVRADRKKIVWEGCQLYRSSLALVNRELCSRLAGDGRYDFRLIATEPQRHEDVCRPDARRFLNSLMRRRNGEPCDVYVRHGWPPDFERPPQAKRFVMIQPWEFGRIPESWVEPINRFVDEMWVPSRHVFETYVSSGVAPEKVWLVPNGVDIDLFQPDGPSLQLRTQKRFRFLFVGGTIWRKGIDALLKAYGSAFGPDDDVCLVIKEMGQNSFYKGQCATEAIHRFRERPDTPEVLYLTEGLSDEEMAALYRACHCLVHPYRGEGFGLPVAEAAASGLPVIVSSGGATDDFVPASAGYFVATRRQGIRLTGELSVEGWLLEPDVESLVRQMQRAYSDQEERIAMASRLCKFVRSRFSWEAAAREAELRLRTLTRE